MIETCKLCQTSRPLVRRSHVIPLWMYKMLPQENQHFRVASSHAGEYQQKSQTGIYGTFVCQNCEDRFAAWDNYASTILRREPKLTEGKWDFGSYDYLRLKSFFLSVLWRAHACGHKFFETVDLGENADSLATCLLDDNVNYETIKDYDVIPTWSINLLSYGLLTPIKVPIESIYYWQLYFPRFQTLINIAEKSGSSRLEPWKMKPNHNLCMLEKHFDEFGEIETVKHVITENIKKRNNELR